MIDFGFRLHNLVEYRYFVHFVTCFAPKNSFDLNLKKFYQVGLIWVFLNIIDF